MVNQTTDAINSMTFADLYKTLSKSQRLSLRLRIVNLTHCSEASIRSWTIHRRNPGSVYRMYIVKALASMGIKTNEETLFPNDN